MRLKVVVTLLSISGGIIAEALQCQYCRGNACNEDDVPIFDCDEQITTLPYNFRPEYVDFESQSMACLELEYLKGRRRMPIRQCLQLSSHRNVCNEIQLSLPTSVKLEKCNVRHKRDADDELTLVDKDSSLESVSTISSDGVTTVETIPESKEIYMSSNDPIAENVTPEASVRQDEITQHPESVEEIPEATVTIANEIPNLTELVVLTTVAEVPKQSEPSVASTTATEATTTLSNEIPKQPESSTVPDISVPKVTLSNEILKNINPSTERVTEKVTVMEVPKTAALASKIATTFPPHVTQKYAVTTSSLMTTTPGGGPRTVYASAATLLTLLIYFV